MSSQPTEASTVSGTSSNANASSPTTTRLTGSTASGQVISSTTFASSTNSTTATTSIVTTWTSITTNKDDSGAVATSTGSAPSSSPSPILRTNSRAIAGAAIGCLVAGLLLGLAFAFFFFRRKRRAGRDGNAGPGESKAFYVPPPPAEPRFQLANFLLDASPDKEMATELRALDTLIQQHVENHYHPGPVQGDPRDLAVSLMNLGIGNGGSLAPEAVAQLAWEPNTRHVALQHVISQVLFTSVDASSRSPLSMLPAPLAAFLRSMPQRESGEKNTEVSSFALNQWRVLSAFLLHPARSQRTPLPTSNTAMAPQAEALADAMNTFLGYFVALDEDNRSRQRSHLLAVITEITAFGYVLLSQPSEWRFVHTPSQQTGGRVAVVCAGLMRVTDKNGTPYSAPRQVVAPSTVLV